MLEGVGGVAGHTRSGRTVLGLIVAVACTPFTTREPNAGNERQPANSTAPLLLPPAPNKQVLSPSAPYEPEVFEVPPEMTAADAQRLLGAFSRSKGFGRSKLDIQTAKDSPRSGPACAELRRPLRSTCDAEESEVVELVAQIGKKGWFVKVSQEDETLARLEGCGPFPKGALRWLRIHYFGQCGVELAEPALAKGGPDLDPTVRGLLVGEVIAEQCRRSVEPVPPFRGGYTPERFERWRRQSVLPWHERTLKRLEACHEFAAILPVGAPGRAAALIGYAQAVGKFASAHRSSPIDEAVSNDDTMRTAYFAALDVLTEPFNALRNAASDEARQEAVREGDYQAYARSFEPPVVVRQAPFHLLGLPPLPRLRGAADQPILTRLPVQLALLRTAHEWLASVEYDSTADWLATLLRQGLPQVIRAQLGEELATMSADDVDRKRLHELLAAGLVRLGLVTQNRAVLERAAYELNYADPNPSAEWLGAVTRALLTPDAKVGVLPWFGYAPTHSEHGTADLSGFTPSLLHLAATDPFYASLAVDHAVIRSIGSWPMEVHAKLEAEATRLARHRGVPLPQRRCVNLWAAVCGWNRDEWGMSEGTRHPCACLPFPWRVEELDP